jgi:hypothetical protein
MKITRFKVPIYGFKIIFVEFEGKQDVEKCAKLFKQEKIPQYRIDETTKDLTNEVLDGGVTDTSVTEFKIVLSIYPCSSERDRRNVIAHECRHAADRILKACSVDDLEAAAWLQGYLAEYIY